MIFKLTVLRWKWGTLLALLFLGSLVACGDAASPEIDLTGTWEGSTVELNPLRLSLNLIDAGGEISGGGTLTWGGFNPITIERVTGSRSEITVNLYIRAPEWSTQGEQFTGTIEPGATALTGELLNLKYQDADPLILRRQ